MQKNNLYFYETPFGNLEVKADVDTGSLVHIKFTDYFRENVFLPDAVKETFRQLDEYFSGKRKEFSLDIDFPNITDFQKKVRDILADIRYGTTMSYKDIAEKLGNVKASRAVGIACSKNLFHIIIPCHRVIGTNGKLTGFAGGLDTKKSLLDHETGNLSFL